MPFNDNQLSRLERLAYDDDRATAKREIAALDAIEAAFDAARTQALDAIRRLDAQSGLVKECVAVLTDRINKSRIR